MDGEGAMTDPRRLSRARHGLALLCSLRPLGYGCDPARRAQVAAGLLAFLGPVDALPCPLRGDAVRVHAEALRWLRWAIHGLRAGTVFGREVQRAIEAGATGVVRGRVNTEASRDRLPVRAE